MKTPNTGVETAQNQSKMGAIKGLSAKIVTALAALGIATSAEKVEGAITIIGAPNSSVSAPLVVSGPAMEGLGITLPENSRLFMNNRGPKGTLVESSSRFTVTLNAADIGAGGTLTISGIATIGTGKAYGQGNGYANTNYDVNQKILWSSTGGPTVTISSLNGTLGLNDADSTIAGPEVYQMSQGFSVDIPISAGGSYNLDNVMESLNAETVTGISNLSFTFSPIPESGAATLGLLGASALLLRRTRENINKQDTNK